MQKALVIARERKAFNYSFCNKISDQIFVIFVLLSLWYTYIYIYTVILEAFYPGHSFKIPLRGKTFIYILILSQY